MLILSRKRDQRIFLGDDIVVTVVDIDRGKVRLGIEAPAGVRVFREEIAPPGHPQLRPPAPPADTRPD